MRNPITDNQIRHEIIKYGVDKSWLDAFGNSWHLKAWVEVYCSADSQLTGQSIRQGLKAIHFGLNQGDLSYYECRSRWYDILFRCRPRHVWLSPKCKAWCRSNQFNASKISGNGPESCWSSVQWPSSFADLQSRLCVSVCTRPGLSLPSWTTGRIRNAESRSHAVCCVQHSSRQVWFLQSRHVETPPNTNAYAEGNSGVDHFHNNAEIPWFSTLSPTSWTYTSSWKL